MVRYCKSLVFAMLWILVLAMTACTVSTFTVTLTAITAAAEAAVPIVTATGQLSAEQGAIVSKYLSAVSDGVQKTATEMSSSDNGLDKATKVTAIWSTVTLDSAVLHNLPPQAKGIMQAVVGAINAFVSQIKSTTMLAIPRGKTIDIVPSLTVTASDKRALSGLSGRAAKIKLALPGK